ncbi:acyl-CoA-like ligand-binding transcription factor [Georgenia yuyongxinii]
MVEVTVVQARRPGRPLATSAAQVEMHAMRLFLEQGFDQTSMTEVATAAGVGRTTLFRYFPSKAEIVLAGFDDHLRRLAAQLRAQSGDVPVMAAVQSAVLRAFAEAVDEEDLWMQRFQVLQQTPTLAPDVAVRWSTWARTVADYVAARTGVHSDDAIPAATGGAIQAAYAATLRTWLRTNDFGGDVVLRMRQALHPVCDGLNQFL